MQSRPMLVDAHDHAEVTFTSPGSASPRDYGAGTLIMGAVAPVIMAVLAVPVWIMFFNV
jgi:hypothetical protein